MRLLKAKKSFWKEFKRQIRYAIVAAVGLIIAYAWKEAIFESTEKLVEKVAESTQFMTNNLWASLVITVIGVMIILISSKLLK